MGDDGQARPGFAPWTLGLWGSATPSRQIPKRRPGVGLRRVVLPLECLGSSIGAMSQCTQELVLPIIYKICAAGLWRAAGPSQRFKGSQFDIADGFIHFSTAEQLAETARLHFAGQSDLVLVAVRAEALGPALRWEPSRRGELFPHLYGDLPLEAVSWVKPITLDKEGWHVLPA